MKEVARAVDARSVYMRPFPSNANLDALTNFFREATGLTVHCVRMRRHVTSKTFKGSVFVEFGSEEEAIKVGGGCGGPLDLFVCYMLSRGIRVINSRIFCCYGKAVEVVDKIIVVSVYPSVLVLASTVVN